MSSEQETKPKRLIPADLNEGQREAYIRMRDFIDSPHGSGMFLLEGYAGTGKAQPLHSKILTPSGWTTMGELSLGDELISVDGQKCKVTGIFPQGEKMIYKVFFSDGASVECCDEHLWKVQNYNQRNGSGKWEVLPLSEIRKNLKYKGRINYSIPLVSPVEYDQVGNLPLDPYLLGLLLGDGCISQQTLIRFSSSDTELIGYLSESCETVSCVFNVYSDKDGHIEGGIVGIDGHNKILETLRDLGLQGSNSKTKFIPDIYIRSSVQDRISLLQGLLDTDGHFSKYSLSYSTSSANLADNVIELVRSLGGTVSISKKTPTYTYKGSKKLGALSYIITIKLPGSIQPFRLKRKQSSYIPKTKYLPIRYIERVEPVKKMEAQCISVSDSSHLYITDEYIVTHNTYCVSKILGYIEQNKPNWKVAVTAPTNKAVKVLRRMGGLGNKKKVTYQTIHKLLGLTEEITADGKQTFTKKFGDECDIEDYNLVIVDEVSMLNDELFEELNTHCGYVKIIFMGDPAQIPPVGKSDCIPFKEELRGKYEIDMYLLTEIMRQTEGNPILEAGFVVRDDLTNPHPPVTKTTMLNDSGHGVVTIKLSEQDDRVKLTELLSEHFASKEFDSNPDYAKVIAWRNVTIDKLNSIIRRLIYKDQDLTKIMIGEKLVANKPIMDRYNIVVFNTNDEFEVVSYSIDSRTCATEAESVKLKYYHTKVEFMTINGQRDQRVIDILHEDSYNDFNRVLHSLKKEALSKKGFDAKKCWVKYYDFMRQFAEVIYNYAITAHKSQGSTYTNVFVMEDDIDRNQNVYERNRIRYTSYSRPTNKLFLVRQ